ncbi:MAG: glycoside hydrolase family 5 protein, partial [Chloroflexota bacterium]
VPATPTHVPATPSPAATATPEGLPEPSVQNLPRWRGFNLQEKFNRDWGSKRFQERDFEWIAELGFNFVRLPMDYRIWAESYDWKILSQAALEEIDQALRFGEQYDVHICINFHRAPGYSVNLPPEPQSLWTDEEAQRVCAIHWSNFARRYRSVPNKLLSFNLLNEPPQIDPQLHRAVIGRLMEAIRKEDSRRLVICDGSGWGRVPPTELLGANVAAATRGYEPMRLTHYHAEWIPGADEWAQPSYPLRDGPMVWSRDTIERLRIQPWKWLEARGMGVMVGEFGVYNRTPHQVVLAWMRDHLQCWRDVGWGWALWNFRGPFGILDSGRADVSYENWRGHKLDRAMLNLLQSF